MDTVLAAFVAIFIMLYAIFSLAVTALSTQEALRMASQQMQTRLDIRARTVLIPISGQITNEGSVVELVYRNAGTIKLADFAQWDVIVEYTDEADGYHIGRLPFISGIPINNEWAVSGMYLNTAQSLPEAYERGIFNPSEELKLSVRLVPAIGHGKTVLVTVSTPNGVSAPIQATRNIVPVIAINTGVTIANGTSGTIDNTMLTVTDIDNPPDELVYTIVTPPTQGTLSLGMTFTQADVDAGSLFYTRTGASVDAFTFILSDGEANIGPVTFIVNP